MTEKKVYCLICGKLNNRAEMELKTFSQQTCAINHAVEIGKSYSFICSECTRFVDYDIIEIYTYLGKWVYDIKGIQTLNMGGRKMVDDFLTAWKKGKNHRRGNRDGEAEG